MKLTETLKDIFKKGAEALKGSARRIFMAQVVKSLGEGGQCVAEREFGWNRGTIRKGTHELENDIVCLDNFSARGRKPMEDKLLNLLDDIKEIAEDCSQTDPTFKTTRLYIRLSAAQVRQQLIERYWYTDAELPCEETIRIKLNQLGYYPQKVKKSQPKEKIPETDDIFEELHRINVEADANEAQLRKSIDAKATILLDNLSRGGYNRVEIKALDHDFRPEETVTPLGVFLPQYNEVYIFLTQSPVTSDFIVDCLIKVWITVKSRFPLVKTIVLNQDNGSECQSRRTQFMKRITDFSETFSVTIQLAYYPPYHSKYNPVERVGGILENYWSGNLLDSVDTVFQFAQNMTYNGIHPIVTVIKKAYYTGIKLTTKAMDELEKRFERLPGLEKWFVRISP